MNINVNNKLYSSEKANIGTSGVPISDTSYLLKHGLQVRAHSTNMSTVFLGPVGLTANSGVAVGYPLLAGTSLTLQVDNPALVYVIATSGNNSSVSWIGS